MLRTHSNTANGVTCMESHTLPPPPPCFSPFWYAGSHLHLIVSFFSSQINIGICNCVVNFSFSPLLIWTTVCPLPLSFHCSSSSFYFPWIDPKYTAVTVQPHIVTGRVYSAEWLYHGNWGGSWSTVHCWFFLRWNLGNQRQPPAAESSTKYDLYSSAFAPRVRTFINIYEGQTLTDHLVDSVWRKGRSLASVKLTVESSCQT